MVVICTSAIPKLDRTRYESEGEAMREIGRHRNIEEVVKEGGFTKVIVGRLRDYHRDVVIAPVASPTDYICNALFARSMGGGG